MSEKPNLYNFEDYMKNVKKKLIEEFVEKLRKYLECEKCTSTGKPISCKACCDLYPIIEEYEERLK